MLFRSPNATLLPQEQALLYVLLEVAVCVGQSLEDFFAFDCNEMHSCIIVHVLSCARPLNIRSAHKTEKTYAKRAPIPAPSGTA